MISVKGMVMKASKWVTPNDPVIIDVGAYIGGTAMKIKELLPDSTVYALEACPKNYRSILKRDVDNQLQVFNLAISDCCQRAKFFVASQKRAEKHNASSGSNSLFRDFVGSKSWAKGVESVVVPAVTLDSFCEQQQITRIDLLKLNCEGCEYKIFDGPLEFLKYTQILIVQMHGHSKTFDSKKFKAKRDRIQKVLASTGFKLAEQAGKQGGHSTQMWVR